MYEWYEAPKDEVAEVTGSAPTITYTEIFSEWRLLEGAFSARLGYDLEEVLSQRSWRWFSNKIHYLLHDANPFSKVLLQDKTPAENQSNTEEIM